MLNIFKMMTMLRYTHTWADPVSLDTAGLCYPGADGLSTVTVHTEEDDDQHLDNISQTLIHSDKLNKYIFIQSSQRVLLGSHLDYIS